MLACRVYQKYHSRQTRLCHPFSRESLSVVLLPNPRFCCSDIHTVGVNLVEVVRYGVRFVILKHPPYCECLDLDRLD